MDWDVFISHASEDKAAVAKPLADQLTRAGLKVWLDANELTIGDSLRQKIDEGLAGSRFGIVVLSRAFFAKNWPVRELNGLASRETFGGKVLLPVWHGVDHAAVAKYSPLLADRLACSTDQGVEHVASEVLRAVRRAAGETRHEPAIPADRPTVTDAGAQVLPRRRFTWVAAVTIAALLIALGVFAYTRAEETPAADAPTARLQYSLLVRNSEGDVRPLAREMLFPRGYGVRLLLTPHEDGLLYVLNQGPTGERVWLYPDSAEEPPLRAAVAAALPSGNDFFKFDEEQGAERLELVWSRAPIPALESIRRSVLERVSTSGMKGSALTPSEAAAVDSLLSSIPAAQESRKEHATELGGDAAAIRKTLTLEHMR